MAIGAKLDPDFVFVLQAGQKKAHAVELVLDVEVDIILLFVFVYYIFPTIFLFL